MILAGREVIYYGDEDISANAGANMPTILSVSFTIGSSEMKHTTHEALTKTPTEDRLPLLHFSRIRMPIHRAARLRIRR